MSKNDALDMVLQRIKNDEEWNMLARLCDSYGKIILEDLTNLGKASAFNKEIRGLYAFFSDEYSPDYDEILKDVAKNLQIKYIPQQALSLYDVECLERLVLVKLMEVMRDNIIIHAGRALWKEIESKALDKLKELWLDGKIDRDEFYAIENEFLKSGLEKLLSNNQLPGVFHYFIINQLFLEAGVYYGIDRLNMKGIVFPFVCVAPVLNPFWLFSIFLKESVFNDEKWQRLTAIVVFVASLRQYQKWCAMVED